MAVSAQSFFQHVDDFMEYRKTVHEISEQTIRSNRIDLDLFQNFVTDHKFDTIDGNVAMKFQYHLKVNRENSGGSINRKIFTLRSYSKHVQLSGVPESETLPFQNVLKIRESYRNRPGALTQEQLQTLFEAVDRFTNLGIRNYAAYALMYQLGLRIGEVHSLNLRDIDLDNDTITVIGKGRKRRVMSLKQELKQILCEWLAVRCQFKNSNLNEALFISKKGNRLAIRTMEDNFNKLVGKAELTAHFNITCHTLRHTMASYLNDNGVDILVLQSLLGHSSTRSTEIYIHPAIDVVRDALEKMPAVIFMKQLIESGELPLVFQRGRVQQRE
jgi:site-specific recombinase XerD